MRSGGPGHGGSASAAERTPVGISLAAGAVALIAAALVASALPAFQSGLRFTLIAVVVGGFAAVTLDELALGGVALVGWLIANGFQENHLGELSWHGSSDIWRIIILVVIATAGLITGEGCRQVRDLRSRWRAEVGRPPTTPDLDAEERAGNA